MLRFPILKCKFVIEWKGLFVTLLSNSVQLLVFIHLGFQLLLKLIVSHLRVIIMLFNPGPVITYKRCDIFMILNTILHINVRMINLNRACPYLCNRNYTRIETHRNIHDAPLTPQNEVGFMIPLSLVLKIRRSWQKPRYWYDYFSRSSVLALTFSGTQRAKNSIFILFALEICSRWLRPWPFDFSSLGWKLDCFFLLLNWHWNSKNNPVDA